MLKRDFFILAMNAGMAKYTSWVISAFAQTQPTDKPSSATPYQIWTEKSNYHFWNPTDAVWVKIDDGTITSSLFDNSERLTVEAGEVPNIPERLEMYYGQLFYNYAIAVLPFGDKIPYSQIGAIETIIADRLVGDETPEDQREGKLSIDEYLLFAESALNLASYSQLFTPAATRKSMLPPPWVKEYREQLYKQYEGNLNDAAVVAAIDKALVDKYREWLSDDASKNFFIKDKQIALNNKKKYLSYGAEPGLENSVKLDPIKEALCEGWNFERMPSYINTARAGSHNRGYQTRLGGEEFKWAVRNTINLMVAEKDCGSTIGLPTKITAELAPFLKGSYAITSKGLLHLTADNIDQYVGQTLKMRSPQYCKLKGNNRCAICCGDQLALSPTGLSAAITGITSGIMYIFMSAAHAKGIKVARLTLDAFI